MIQLTAELIEGFAGIFLSPGYDAAKPTPEFHREGWRLYCSSYEFCTLVAPRGHAKSTAFTYDFALAEILFRSEQYIVLVSATEDLAKDHLADIARTLRENDEIRSHFGIAGLLTDAKTEIVVKFLDGGMARLIAKGSGQKMRGLKWNNRRPGLIICDDLEDDEQVENDDRRKKFRRWFNRALLPSRRQGGRVRVHGTIIHEDSLLARLQKSTQWRSLFYKAHFAFDDFSQVLWPEHMPAEKLRAEQQRMVEDGDASGYSQEYLNDPFDNAEAYIQSDWFTPMQDEDYHRQKIMGCAADFAISKSDQANRSSLTAGGMDTRGLLHYVGQDVGRWDSFELVEHLFDFAARWKPDVFWVEDGVIWMSIWPMIKKEMQLRAAKGKPCWINFVTRPPIKDKKARGRSLQRRMRADGTRWATEAPWFSGMKSEILRFTGDSDAKLDDQFDSAALLSLGFDEMAEIEEEDFTPEEELAMIAQDPREAAGRNPVTGY